MAILYNELRCVSSPTQSASFQSYKLLLMPDLYSYRYADQRLSIVDALAGSTILWRVPYKENISSFSAASKKNMHYTRHTAELLFCYSNLLTQIWPWTMTWQVFHLADDGFGNILGWWGSSPLAYMCALSNILLALQWTKNFIVQAHTWQKDVATHGSCGSEKLDPHESWLDVIPVVSLINHAYCNCKFSKLFCYTDLGIQSWSSDKHGMLSGRSLDIFALMLSKAVK